MSYYLNPGNKNFEICAKARVYVDKTGLIGYTNKVLSTKQKCICVTHPRRFGKTYAADMLAAYYSRGCDSRALFENLKIASDPSFETHLNKYDVFRINMADVINMTTGAETGIKELSEDLADNLKEAYPDISYEDENNIPSMLKTVYEETGTKFVFIIDEWDCPMRERKADEESQRLYLQFLRGLLKDKKYLVLAYMTGILPIKQMGESGPNNFDEFTMTDCSPMQEYFGFTEEEVKELCEERGRSFDEMREWYDGYDIEGVTIYNPWSVTSALEENCLEGYWTNTAPIESLRRYVTMDRFGLKAKVLFLLSGEEVPVDTGTFKRDLGRLDSADEVLTALIHLGYLTYDSEKGTARIPNHEIRLEFEDAMEDTDEWGDVIADVRKSYELLKSLLRGENAAVAEGMYEAHESSASIIEYNDENSLACTIRIALYAAMKDYVFIRELPAGKGFADVVLVPKDGKEVPPVIVELKYGGSAKGAIAQIKERRYADRFKGLKRDIYLVGINYDEKSKVHDCLIEVMGK